MKKKLFAFMTACMLTFALAACGNTGSNAEESTIPEPDTTETPAVETKSKAETEESAPPADTSEETTESQSEPEDTAETGLVVYFLMVWEYGIGCFGNSKSDWRRYVPSCTGRALHG